MMFDRIKGAWQRYLNRIAEESQQINSAFDELFDLRLALHQLSIDEAKEVWTVSLDFPLTRDLIEIEEACGLGWPSPPGLGSELADLFSKFQAVTISDTRLDRDRLAPPDRNCLSIQIAIDTDDVGGWFQIYGEDRLFALPPKDRAWIDSVPDAAGSLGSYRSVWHAMLERMLMLTDEPTSTIQKLAMKARGEI